MNTHQVTPHVPEDDEADTVLPSIQGFHCDGECWATKGKAEELIKWLEAASPELRDWFAYGEWAQEEPQEHPLPPMADIHPIQDFLVLATVERYQATGYLKAARNAKFYETHPVLFRWEGKYFILQGTHRLAAHFRSDPTTFRGWVLDLDARVAAQA